MNRADKREATRLRKRIVDLESERDSLKLRLEMNELVQLTALNSKACAELDDAQSEITAAYQRGLEDAARIADRDDQSAWGIAREIRFKKEGVR